MFIQVGDACSPGICGGNEARCTNTITGYACLCPFGRAGRNCEEEINITQPAFTGKASPSSYLSLSRPKHILRTLKVGFRFKATPSAESGLVKVCVYFLSRLQ